ncbi:MAG TPA: hypothetical protein PLS66_08705, partial [Tepiditoga sp.]|nr:hypothetical protein [Tepiditoga sp.]
VWSFNGKPVNGNEITFKPAERISGGVLKVSFFDIWGKEYSLNSELNVYKPEISILNPVNNTKIPYGEKIIFSGIISDMDSYEWSVNGETVAENTQQKEYEFNSVGDFEIKLIGNFMDESFEKIVNVKVDPPIQKTDADLNVLIGDPVNLNLRISQGIKVNEITWYYDGEEIGKGISLSYVFSGLGEKDIKAVYGDYEVVYTVNVANVSVISPRDGDYYLPGNIKLVSESNTDNVQWFVNGEFAGTGKQINYDFTDYGEYLIQVGSTDSKGINIYIYKSIGNAVIEGAENDGQYYNDNVLELSVIAETEIGIKSVLWYVDDSPVYTGNNFKPDLKFMGASRNHKIKAEVTDIKGNMTFAEIIIFVMEKPEFRIISPSDKSTFSVGEEFVISGNFISGSFDSVESLVWYYDGDAVSENTLSAVVKAESEGEKEIKAVLKDKLGNEFTKEITVKITNNSYIRITSPVQNQKFVFGENINAQAEGFRNTAAGKQNLDMDRLSWKLNSEDIGAGKLIVLKNLNPGEYTLTAVHPEVQDSVSVDFTVTKPDIVIGLNDGFIYNAGTKLKLS